MYVIAGRFGRRHLVTPKGSQTRPSAARLREALFSICQNSIEGACFLDLFAGSGAIGIEALSRGAHSSVFVENHRDSMAAIRQNIQTLGLDKETRCIHGDVFSALQKLEKENCSFDIIYADPPYQTVVKGTEQFYSALLVEWIDQHKLLNSGGILFVEEAFHSAPTLSSLKNLNLKDSRRLGQACLQQYLKI